VKDYKPYAQRTTWRNIPDRLKKKCPLVIIAASLYNWKQPTASSNRGHNM